jgi:glutaredoxin-like YruB-family protein
MANVTIYSTPTCGYCQMAKEYFTSIKQAYTEHNVQADRAMAEEMIKKTGQFGVPVIDIDGQVVIGFDRKRIDDLLKASPAKAA